MAAETVKRVFQNSKGQNLVIVGPQVAWTETFQSSGSNCLLWIMKELELRVCRKAPVEMEVAISILAPANDQSTRIHNPPIDSPLLTPFRCTVEFLCHDAPSHPRMRHFVDAQSLFTTPPKPLSRFAFARLIASARSILDRSNTACSAVMSDGADTSSTRVIISLSPLIATTPAEVSFPFRIMAMMGSECPSLDPMRRKKRSVALAGCVLSNSNPTIWKMCAYR